MSTELEKTLIHEMTHAIAGDLGGATVPRDVHEGLAQYLEGERVGNRLPASLVASLAGGGQTDTAGFYEAALSFVEHLISLRGKDSMTVSNAAATCVTPSLRRRETSERTSPRVAPTSMPAGLFPAGAWERLLVNGLDVLEPRRRPLPRRESSWTTNRPRPASGWTDQRLSRLRG